MFKNRTNKNLEIQNNNNNNDNINNKIRKFGKMALKLM